MREQLRNVAQVRGSSSAFAAICRDGKVVTWGNAHFGGDSAVVQDRLTEVRDISATGGAFAAVCRDGSLVVWGSPDYGCDMSAAEKISDVREAVAPTVSIRVHRRVHTCSWMKTPSLPNFACTRHLVSCLPPRLHLGVGCPRTRLHAYVCVCIYTRALSAQVVASAGAFAVLKADGTVATVGRSDCGARTAEVAPK